MTDKLVGTAGKAELIANPDHPKPILTTEEHGKYNRYENYAATFTSQDLTNLTRYLEGQVLTLVEACISDKQQLEAVKSLGRKMLWSEMYELVQQSLYKRQSDPESSLAPII